MKKALVVFAICSVASVAAFAAPTRVDYNGEFASTWDGGAVSTDPAYTPPEWQYYLTGSGGGIGVTWSQDPKIALQYEDESHVYPNPGFRIGHSVIFGDTGTGSGTYGISHVINTVAGYHYHIIGTQQWSKAPTVNVRPEWGLVPGDQRSNPTGGVSHMYGNYFEVSSGAMGKQSFQQSVIATGDQLTAYVGVTYSNLDQAFKFNGHADGVRVLESPIIVYKSLHNGDFSQHTNITNWKSLNPGDGNAKDQYMFDGWLPMGESAGQIDRIEPVPDAEGFGFAMHVDQWKAGGRRYFFQRINDELPAHEWTLTADVYAYDPAASDSRIGIDPTGGMDPNSPNIIWSEAQSLKNAWETLSVTAMGQGTNGITVWIASGWDLSRGQRSGDTAGAKFANVQLVPEPATMLLLALGGLACLRRR